MLSETQMVAFRKSVESLYDSVANIFEHEEFKKANGATSHRWKQVFENVPCRRSFKTVRQTDQTDTFANVKQIVKLIISPDVKIAEGSKIELMQGGKKEVYKAAGMAAHYNTHQEIILEVEKKT